MQIIRIILLIIMAACAEGRCNNFSAFQMAPTAAPAVVEEPSEQYQDFVIMDINLPDYHYANFMEGLSLGDPNAPVHVTQFADFQCPACGYNWSELEPTLISEYINTGQVYLFYSPFSFLGDYGGSPDWDESKKAAEAALCANDQYSFWFYHDLLYANQNGENQGAFDRDYLMTMAYYLGLDMQSFATCLDYGDHSQEVEDANDFAEQMGATYTPSFLVNGRMVSMDELFTAIESELE